MHRKNWTQMMTVILTVTTVLGQSPVVYAAEVTQEPVFVETEGEAEPSDYEIVLQADDELAVEEIDNGDLTIGSEEESAAPAVSTVLPEGVPGMPEGFTLSKEAMEWKEDAAAHHVTDELKEAVAGRDYAENQVFFLADSEEYAQTVAAAYGAVLLKYDQGVATLDLTDSGLTVEEAVAIGADPANGMPLVEPNYRLYEPDPDTAGEGIAVQAVRPEELVGSTSWEDWYYAMENPDPLLDPSNPNYQWWHDAIGDYGAWGMLDNLNLGSSDITVAVIDTGVLSTHEEFTGHTTQAVEGEYFKARTMGTHGSHVAGIIGASADNGKGGAGIAPGVQIMALCVVSDDGIMYDANILAAVNYAVSHGAKVINMSLGGPQYNTQEKAVLKSAYEKGVTIVVAAGNEAANNIAYPAGYTDYVIGVAALKQDGTLTQFSTYGPVVDIAAPGADMLSCSDAGNSAYEKAQGTSQACPVVAGACALYMSVMGPVSPAKMREVIKKSAKKCSSAGAGAGILNVAGMFGGDTTAPKISTEGDSIVITPAGFSGDAKENASTKILYTTDGKLPSMKNGQIVYGQIYTGSFRKSEIEAIRKTAKGKTVKVTIKAVAVTGSGVVSKPATAAFSYTQASDPVTEIALSGQAYVPVGTKATYKATLKNAAADNKKVTWSILYGDSATTADGGKVKINENTGVVEVAKDAAVGKTYTLEADLPHGPQATISFTVVAAKSTKLSVVEETSSIVDQSKLESVFHVTKKQDSLS
ncbi:MAG: S8 family serine peptidase, partial [Lachnospiraceae bacterium]|nr:S8 family serine peptidase [Lachnospiraceae bacterium]